jgi:hypothetical protein
VPQLTSPLKGQLGHASLPAEKRWFIVRWARRFTPSPRGGEGGMRGLGRCDTESSCPPLPTLSPPSPLRDEGVKCSASLKHATDQFLKICAQASPERERSIASSSNRLLSGGSPARHTRARSSCRFADGPLGGVSQEARARETVTLHMAALLGDFPPAVGRAAVDDLPALHRAYDIHTSRIRVEGEDPGPPALGIA